MEEKTFLRRTIRQRRRALSQLEQRRASSFLIHNIKKEHFLKRFKHIAIYFPCNGEISLLPLLDYLKKYNKIIYLPILKKNKMYFMRYEGKLKKNRFNIPEPAQQFKKIHPSVLNVVFTPLLAFDDQGNRLGMGGGFYDRCFNYLSFRSHKKPLLYGVAYDWQRISTLNPSSWDIPLQKVITDQRIYHFYEHRN
jgi:5-formyltetrahydrofolate cyclo-ligase